MYTLRGRDLTDLKDGFAAASAAQSELRCMAGPALQANCEPEGPARAASPSLGGSIGCCAAVASSSLPASALPSPRCSSPAHPTSLPTPHPPQVTEAMLQAKAAYCSGRANRNTCSPRHCNAWRRCSNRSRGNSRQSSRLPIEFPSASMVGPAATESWTQEETDTTAALESKMSALESKLAPTSLATSDVVAMDALRQQNKELSERLQKKSQELVKAHDKLHRLEQERNELRRLQGQLASTSKCMAPCCLPVARLEKAGLNIEPMSGLDATWAGYVFSLASVQVRSSGLTFSELFRKHRNSQGRMDEAAFRDFIHQFFPKIFEDRLTRLFFFADCDGSGHLNFLEFLRIFGCDINGKMGEEYFEHVMVRIHRAIGKRGGLSSVLHLRDRNVQVDGSLNRQRMIDLLLELNVGLNRREAFDLTATFDPQCTGEVQIVEFSDAMNMCASACFVTEEWVHKLFDQVVTMLHIQSRSLYKALEPVAAKGSMNRIDLQTFLRQLVPDLRDSQVDRVYNFLLSGMENRNSHRTGEIELSHFFSVVCRPSLGPTPKGKTDVSLPYQVTERLALQLDRLCGSLSKAFDLLNPCLFIEEFRASLISLGFAPGMDFTQVFNLLDVHRNGRVQRNTFIQVLQRHVQRLQAAKRTDSDSTQFRNATRDEERAASKLARFVRKKMGSSHSGAKISSAVLFESRLHEQFAILPVRLPNGSQAVPYSQHAEALRDQQRAINRILVLENDLEYAKRRLAQGFGGHADRGQSEDVRVLETANHRLFARLREVKHFIKKSFEQRSSPKEQRMEVRCASAPPVVQRRAAAICLTDRDEFENERDKLQSQVAEGHEEIKVLQQEKASLQQELASRMLQERSMPPSRSASKNPLMAISEQEKTTADYFPDGLPDSISLTACDTPDESKKSTSRWGILRSVARADGWASSHSASSSRPPSQRGSTVIAFEEPKDNCTTQVLNALQHYRKSYDIRKFLQTTIGLSINNRFTIRGVVTVESDSVVLRCTDAYLRREVAVKLPNIDDFANRRDFLRECVIYSHLLDVTEVQDVYHFPGLCEQMVCCVMELLRGRLLSNHFTSIRKGEDAPLTVYEAAEICDALLYGISECHTRGVVHLDLKPSVVWEVRQPAKVVVKILDFGLAHLTNRSLLTTDARHLFETRRASDDEDEDVRFVVDSGADGPFVKVPNLYETDSTWTEFAPYALLRNWGTPWYMSPSRWCSYIIRNQRSSVVARDLRWCDSSAGQSLTIEHGTGDDLDTANVGAINEYERVVQATETVPQLPEGSYFEIIIRKVWPRHILQPASDKRNKYPGLALGFTITPPPSKGRKLPEFAKEIPNSWIIGYGGRLFINGVEAKVDDMAPAQNLAGFRRRQASSPQGEGLDNILIHEMDGPLGWSFGELYRGDRLGIMASHAGHLEVYVNSHLISKLRVPSLDNHMFLYPVVDLAGRFREVGLVPQPRSPSGEYRLHCFQEHRQLVERFSRRALMPSNDVFAAGLIVQECFASHAVPKVPLAFVHLLRAIKQWHKHDRPPITESGDILKALYHWAKEDRICKEVPSDIMEVLVSVFNGSRCDEPSEDVAADSSTDAIHRAQHFRMALNEKTSWCHMSSDFLRSHVKNEVIEKAATNPFAVRPQQQRLADKFVTAARQMISGITPHSQEDTWDLTGWTLSSSHVRRVVQVLHSSDGEHIGVVNVLRFEPNVPVELMLRFVNCFRGFPSSESSDSSDSESSHIIPTTLFSPRKGVNRNAAAMATQRRNRQLLFNGVQFPSSLCPVPFAKLQEANAIGLILHFVRKLELGRGPQDGSAGSDTLPMGGEGASLLATGLHKNEVLQQLGACGQGFADMGASVLARALPQCTSLRTLDLRSNGISDSGAKALSDALRRDGSVLQVLDLTDNDIGSSGCRHLAGMLSENESLIRLNVQRNQIGDDGAVSIGDALHSNFVLQELDMGRNCISVWGAGKLARSTRANTVLQSLNLQDNALDALVATALAEAFANQSVSAKRVGKRLSSLSPDTHPLATSSCSMLRRLNLRHNNLGSAGAAELLRALRTNYRLSSLNLAWNELSGEAAKAFAALFGAGSVCTLEDVDLRDNLLGEGAALGFAMMAAIVTANTAVNNTGNANNANNASSSAREDSSDRTSPEAPAKTRVRSSAGNVRNSTGARSSVGNPRLGRRQTLSFNSLTTTGDGQRITGLRGRYTEISFKNQNDVLKTTAGMCMRTLNLANCRLDIRGIGMLAKAMPNFQNLENLYLYNNTRIGSRDNSAIVASESCVSLAPLETKSAMERPLNTSSLASPVNAAIESLCDFVSSLSLSLRHLSLGSCMLGAKVGTAILTTLAGRVALKELDLSDNDFTQNDLLMDAIQHFLKSSPALCRFGLALNSLGDSGVATVARVLGQTNQDIIVDLAANNVSSEIRDVVSRPCVPEKNASSSKEPGDAGDASKTPVQSLAESLAADLCNMAFPVTERLLI